jgi:hypothetical protein
MIQARYRAQIRPVERLGERIGLWTWRGGFLRDSNVLSSALNRHGNFEIYDDGCGYGYVTLTWNTLMSEQ